MDTTPLRTLRKQRGLSLGEVAKDCGLDKSNLSRLERGVAGASLETAETLAEYFGRQWITELHILYPHRFSKSKKARGA